MAFVDVPYPAAGFHFTVKVVGSGASLQSASGADGGFQEVSGLEAQMMVETIQSGGANGSVLQLPNGIRYPNLVLRRGYIASASFLSEWVAQTLSSNLSQPLFTQGLLVALLDERSMPLAAWYATGAWPVRWTTGPLDASKNDVLTEVLEFTYASIARVPLGSATAMAASVDRLMSAPS